MLSGCVGETLGVMKWVCGACVSGCVGGLVLFGSVWFVVVLRRDVYLSRVGVGGGGVRRWRLLGGIGFLR